MNKQEAIKEIDGYAVISTFVPKSIEVIKIEKAKEIISQIHEPQKVVVPNIIGKWIEVCKTSRLGSQLNVALQGFLEKVLTIRKQSIFG